MALQGTLDTFELPDVLRLLASTKKTGRLHLRGDRGEGSVWLHDGQVIGVRTDATPDGDVGEGLFDLFRAREGGFAFEPGETPDASEAPADVEPLLVATERRLAEWREIEAVVPSLHAWVTLSPDLPQPEVTVDAATWRLVAAIGSGLTVGDLAAALDLREVAVSRVVRDLVVLGLGAVTDAPAVTATWEPESATTSIDAAGAFAASLDHGTTAHDVPTFDSGFGHDTTAGYDEGAYGAEAAAPAAASSWDHGYAEPEEPAPLFAAAEPAGYGAGQPEPVYAAPAEPAIDHHFEDDDDADEVARQLAMLSPRAAQAVAAAAAADTDSERDAHLDALADSDEPINRGLLLKFLSSVKS